VEQEARLTIIEHLQDLRKRLLYSIIGIVVGIAISIPLIPHIFTILKSRAEDVDLVFIYVTEMVGIYMKVAFYCGIALALPWIIYQLILFFSPGLTGKEKRYVYFSLPVVFLLFVCGVCFAYFIFLPPAFKFLLSLGSDVARPMISVNNYISVVAKLLFSIGLIFEIPLVITSLAKIGLVSPAKLAKGRKWAVLAAFIFGAIITPTVDPINQTLLAAPIIALYELSIWLSKLVYHQKALAPSATVES
jgi:sec-independent protein translocase protein TatC